MNKAKLEKIQWNEIKHEVEQVNPKLVETIDEADPKGRLSVYVATYPYGSYIIKEGKLFIPNDKGKLVPLNDNSIDNTTQSDLAYSMGGMPAGILLEKSAQECLKDINNCSLPLAMLSPGSIFALWKWLDTSPAHHPVKVFDITAGAQCTFMLPNIGDTAFHKNLRRDFNISNSPPKTLSGQWRIFKELANHPEIQCNWQAKLLFFSGEWIEKIREDKNWHAVYLMLLKNAWEKSAYERNQMFYDYALSCAQATHNLKPNPYLVDIIRHLIMIAEGSAAGFGVAHDDSYAPVSMLQDIYLNHYKLRHYLPTIITPKHFSIFDLKEEPIYYSLQFPTSLEFSPKSRKASNILTDLCELKHILNLFLEEINKGALKIEDTIIGMVAKNVKFDFYHTKPDRHGEVKHTEHLLKTHPEIDESSKFKDERLPALNSAFLRGCIQIRHNTDEDEKE